VADIRINLAEDSSPPRAESKDSRSYTSNYPYDLFGVYLNTWKICIYSINPGSILINRCSVLLVVLFLKQMRRSYRILIGKHEVSKRVGNRGMDAWKISVQ
jgi:hypothetical protein